MLTKVNEQYRVNGLHSEKCQRMGDVFSCEIKERLDSIGGEPAGCPCEQPKKGKLKKARAISLCVSYGTAIR